VNGSISIPEKFKLNGKPVLVIVDDDYCSETGCFGEAAFDERLITLCHRFRGKVMKKKEKE
jgi:hypothetical protein